MPKTNLSTELNLKSVAKRNLGNKKTKKKHKTNKKLKRILKQLRDA